LGGLRGAEGLEKAEAFWTAAFAEGGIDTWMSEPEVRHYINEQVTGSPHEWPMEWFQRVHSPTPYPLGLSVGCGDGALERDVRRKGICNRIVGVDLSEGALASASEQAESEGIDGISYLRDDFNTFRLDRAQYDIVFFHQSLHHVARLERCVPEVASSLKTDGLLYLDEYVGPSRDDWNDELLADAQRVYESLPRSIRTHRRVPAPVVPEDPSEAVRSGEILEFVVRSFRVIERRDYGGNLLALIHPLVRWSRLEAENRAALLDRLMAEERSLLAGGAPSFYTVVVARPL
jgi:SAM-dependent methyltransferase